MHKTTLPMKRISILLSFICLGTFAKAQMPKLQKAEIKTPGALCQVCKTTIESTAPKYADGLMKVTVNFRMGTTAVQWYPDRTNIEEVKTAIANCGYDADDVEANPDAYKMLPLSCKILEAGKGHPDPKKKPS
jgi:copper chaperone CopZ